MALRLLESFDTYNPASPDYLRKWSHLYWSTPPVQSAAARTGPYGCHLNGSQWWGISWSTDNQQTWFVGCAVRLAAGSTTGGLTWRVNQQAGQNTLQCSVRYSADGNIYLYRGNGATLLTSFGSGVTTGQWLYLEISFFVDGTTGYLKVAVNGTQVGSVVGANTQAQGNNTVGEIEFVNDSWNGNVNPGIDVDDLYICDGTTGQNNNVLGVTHVQCLWPVSGNNGWSPSNVSVPNYVLANDQVQDGDASYVYTQTAGQKELYGFGTLYTAATAIFGTLLGLMVRKDDAGSRLVAPVAESGGVDTVGTSAYPADDPTYLYVGQFFPTDPNTGVAWTQAALQAASFGASAVA